MRIGEKSPRPAGRLLSSRNTRNRSGRLALCVALCASILCGCHTVRRFPAEASLPAPGPVQEQQAIHIVGYTTTDGKPHKCGGSVTAVGPYALRFAIRTNSRDTGGLSFFTRQKFGDHTVRPLAIAALSVLKDKTDATMSEWGASGNLVNQIEYHDTNSLMGGFLGPGLEIGGNGLHLTVEGRYEPLAGRGAYDDNISVMAGVGFR